MCKGRQVKRVATEDTDTKSYSRSRMDITDPVRKIVTIKKIREPSTNDLWVPIKAGDITSKMFIDSGCDFTIIPPKYYDKSMGTMMEPDINLRAWGAKELLNVKGMVNTQLTTERGAKKKTRIYIVDGIHPEPLLGAFDAEDLGFLTINKEGRAPTQSEYTGVKAITPQMIRGNLGKQVITHTIQNEPIPETEIEKVMETVNKFKGVVFDDKKVGKMKTKPIHLEYDNSFTPEQPRFRNVPIHYQPEVSQLLKFLREQGVITDVDPRNSFECVMNVLFSDKK